MKLQDCRDAEVDFSSRASELARKLAFAGLAIIWIFKVDVQGSPTLPSRLEWALALIVAGLSVDLFHYVFSAVYWGWKVKSKEADLVIDAGKPSERFDEEKEFTNPLWFDRLLNMIFLAKLAFIGAAYFDLLLYIATAKLFR